MPFLPPSQQRQSTEGISVGNESVPKIIINDKKCSVTVFNSSPGLSLLPLLSSTLPGPSASEDTTLWHYADTFIIIIFSSNCNQHFGNFKL